MSSLAGQARRLKRRSPSSSSPPAMERPPIAPELSLLSRLRSLRWSTIFVAIVNVVVASIASFIGVKIAARCGFNVALPFLVVLLLAAARMASMVGTGIAQKATAITILSHQLDDAAAEAVVRQDRRLKYKRWLWWTRFGMLITLLQFFGASYLVFIIMKEFSLGQKNRCSGVQGADENRRTKFLIVILLILVWLLVSIQFCIGSDVLRWRSFYATHDSAWRAHYSEVFDHGIREALCCLGRIKYLSVLEEDEVYSVARLLGDLFAYRAAGTGHLELLDLRCCKDVGGLQFHMTNLWRHLLIEFRKLLYIISLLKLRTRDLFLILEETLFYFLVHGCSDKGFWLHGPVKGDNWWRGHAAAFLKFVDLPPSGLRRGRVSQVKREAAYFVVVLHHLRSVVIAVRGTETPEDLLTDGLCRDCILTDEDLDGLINNEHLIVDARRLVLSTYPHYGHSGIVESARELHMQLDGKSEENEGHGFLSSLMGAGGECHGYRIRIVGHSLGGAVATLLGIRLCRKYPNLHVYSYGTLPCVDPVIAEACSHFVTSIIYNDEFSARLSICSVLRLRAAAIAALAQDSSANSAMICKLARRILQTNQSHATGEKEIFSSPFTENLPAVDSSQSYRRRHYIYTTEGSERVQDILIQEANAIVDVSTSEKCIDFFDENIYGTNHDTRPYPGAANDLFPSGDILIHISDGESSTQPSKQEPQEVFLPGLIIHIIPESRKTFLALCKSWKGHGEDGNFRAYIASRETFKDLVVSPYMFLDHLPWRCHYALQRVLEERGICGKLEDNFLCEGVTV
ncbi:uncharacterized protein LOC116260359 isoform X2 [Nymphaea colorata]|uniref:uncharacterized protein LOC116260359 isoform X2 n=1 Tax=Nymphaea colorata TaxID=210225 RepID=UPI00129DFF96|nr:uncharacterized protein LOC116260359 isoform X2 [Nymphaea colorata]